MILMSNGKTRVVLLVGKYAVKVARINPIEYLAQSFRLFLKDGFQGDYKQLWQKYFVWGIWANQAERSLYKQHGDIFLAPTLFSFLGLVNIQIRGESVRDEDIAQHPLHELLEGTPLAREFLRSEQFCLIGTRFCLADYGTPKLGKFLS